MLINVHCAFLLRPHGIGLSLLSLRCHIVCLFWQLEQASLIEDGLSEHAVADLGVTLPHIGMAVSVYYVM